MKNYNNLNALDHLSNLLFVLFLGLKLTGHIAWSWWWVTAPLWVPFGLAFVLSFIAGFFLTARKKQTAAERARREGRGIS